MKKYKIACLVSHPIQYQVPLFREISKDSRFDLEVLYCSSKSLKAYRDEGFNRSIDWDIPLIGGYKHIFLPRVFESARPSFFSPLNYGIYPTLKKGNFDAIWIHGWSNWAQLSAILIAKMLGIKILIRGESGIHLKNPTGVKFFFRAVIMTYLKEMVDGFLAIGTNNREFYLHYGISPKKIFLVPYAVDNNFFAKQFQNKQDKSLELREQIIGKHKATVILFASKLENRKRADFLIKAFEKLSRREDLINLPYLLIVGDGPEKLKLEKNARKMNLNNISFLGFKNQTELPIYYSIADIFVLPSKQEPWGLVVNEVMNFDCAVIVSDEVGCAEDLVIHGESGFVFQSDSEQELVDCLSELCLDIEKQRQFVFRAKQKIQNWGFREDISGLYQALESACQK